MHAVHGVGKKLKKKEKQSRNSLFLLAFYDFPISVAAFHIPFIHT